MGARLAVVFPGQGSQRPAMGAGWQERPGWAAVVRGAEVTGHDLPSLLLEADADTLVRTDLAQLATLALELVIHAELTAALAGSGVEVVVTAGHSLGEYAALAAAGVLTPEQAVSLVGVRGRAMVEACRQDPGTMAVVQGADPGQVAAVVDRIQDGGGRVWIANENGPRQTVLAGDAEGVDLAAEQVRDLESAKVVRIPVSGAFHTPLMAGARPALEQALAGTAFADGTCPVVANVDGAAHRGGPRWRARLADQLTEPVRWRTAMGTMVGLGCDLLAEVGPGRVLGGLLRIAHPDVPRGQVSTPEQLDALVARL